MAMMDVWVVRMGMNQRLMLMRMTVRLDPGKTFGMPVLMVFVVDVKMLVNRHLMLMLMLVTFAEMKPDTERHQRG